RLLAKRYRSFLAALAVNVEELLLEVDVAEVEIHRLAAAQAGRVDQLREGAVPEPEWAFRLEPREYGVDFGRLGRVGQAPRAPWRERAVRYAIRPEREPDERAHGRELACDRGGGQLRPPPPQLGRVVGEHPSVEIVQLRAPLRQPRAELAHVDG